LSIKKPVLKKPEGAGAFALGTNNQLSQAWNAGIQMDKTIFER